MATNGPVSPEAAETETVTENAALKAAKEKAEAENKTRSGKGTRIKVGQTRGRNPQVISWEAFDESLPDTLPSSFAEFSEITKKTDERDIVSMLIDGYNSQQYSAASDPIGEYVNPAWPDDVQKQFKLVVRNYAAATGKSIEDAVKLIKPGIEASQQK